MDLIYLDENLREQGVIKNASFSSEIGTNYDFMLTVPKTDYAKLGGKFIYPQGAFEFGGKIITCDVDSSNDFVTFNGVTWLGFLGMSKILWLQYDQEELSLDAHIDRVLAYVRMQGIMIPNTGVTMESPPSNPDFDNHELSILEIILDLFSQAGVLPAVKAVYSGSSMAIEIGAKEPEHYDPSTYSDTALPVSVIKQYQPVTYIGISCVDNDLVLPIKQAYLGSDGIWHLGQRGCYTGFNTLYASVMVDYDSYQNPDWAQIAKDLQRKDSASVNSTGKLFPDVGDLVTGRDETTGVEVTESVTSKTLDWTNGVPIFAFET